MNASAVSDERVRKRLFRFLWAYEIIAIAVLIGAGINLAVSQGGSLILALPLALVAAAEAMRIALSGWSGRVTLGGRLLAYLGLAAIAIGSFEGLSIAFDQFWTNRAAATLRVQHVVEIAQRAADLVDADRARRDADVASLAAQVNELDAQIANLARSLPAAPAGSSKVCSTKHGQRVGCAVDVAAVAVWRDAMRAYDARLAGLAATRAGLQAKVDAARSAAAAAGSPKAAEALLAARQDLDEKLQESPLHRITAAVFNENVSNVTPDQFSTVKKWALIGWSGAYAALSVVVSLAAHSPSRSGRPGKVSRAIRAYLARKRRPLVVWRDIPVVEFRDRVRMVYVPTDPQTGRVLDPDGSKS